MDSVLLPVSAGWEATGAGKEEISNSSWHAPLPACSHQCGWHGQHRLGKEGMLLEAALRSPGYPELL